MLTWFVYALAFLVGVVQTPLLVDLLRVIFPGWKVKRLTSQAASVMLILLLSIFALNTLGLQIFYFIPLMPDVPFRRLKIVCHSVFAYWVWINMAVNYYYAVFTHPGSFTAAQSPNESNPSIEQLTIGTDPTERDGGKSNMPKTADLRRSNLPNREVSLPTEETDTTSKNVVNVTPSIVEPEKNRYCKKCQTTVTYMDHHCPFTGNCVGLNTYSYFFLCLCYASVGLGYSLLVGVFYFGECLLPSVWNWLQLNPLDKDTCVSLESFSELFVPTIGGFVVLNVIIGFQVFLLLSDLTTFELLTNFWKAPVFQIGWKRILNREHLKKESRLNVLLLSRRRGALWFLIPVRNIQ